MTADFAPRSAAHRHVTLITLAVSIGGLLLFAYTLRKAGLSQIGEGLRHVGLGGFAAILALSGLRFAVRTLAWMRCVPPGERLPFADGFSATIMGEALGNATPLATLVSEPSKALFVRHLLPLAAAFSAIVIENIFYTATVGLVIGLGAVAMLLAFPISPALRWAGLGAVGGMALIVGSAYLLLGADVKPVTATIDWLRQRGLGGQWLGAQLERVRRFEQSINRFTGENRQHLGSLGLFEVAFHLCGVAEVFLTLVLIAPDSASVLKAIVLESVGRVINILFKFIPMRVGVDEAGNALFAAPLSIPTPALVVLPLARKARILAWTAVGLAMVMWRGLSVRGVVSEAEELKGNRRG